MLGTACGGPSAEATRLRLATTTSTRDSGLLDWLLPPFEAATGIEVQVVAVGTGQALALGRRGDADLLLVHARRREDAFLAAGDGLERRDVMWNDFVLVGPRDDPAGIRGLGDGARALARIGAHRAVFISRGDDSGTHTRERALWKKAGGRPAWDGYLEAGQGMGACLTIADEKQAYTLTDRGTWLARRSLSDLVVLVEGHPALRNPYGTILVDPRRHPGVHAEAARKLFEYLTSREGQERIGAYRVDGVALFHPVKGP
ncbi:MAG: substrate-binding domain-containing protein [Planctomycetota bacterium]